MLAISVVVSCKGDLYLRYGSQNEFTGVIHSKTTRRSKANPIKFVNLDRELARPIVGFYLHQIQFAAGFTAAKEGLFLFRGCGECVVADNVAVGMANQVPHGCGVDVSLEAKGEAIAHQHLERLFAFPKDRNRRLFRNLQPAWFGPDIGRFRICFNGQDGI